jgi:hypothetical protein
MGGFKRNTKPGTYLVQNQEQLLRQELNPGEKIEISILINSIQYFIDCVFIAVLKNKFHLVALQHQQALCDSYYFSFEECKIAFDKLFKDKAWSEEIIAKWSPFYPPEQEWLAKKQCYLEGRQEKF